MKTRSDFVSNSSSCSFVIALNSEYDTSRFIKDLAKACVNPKSEYHNKDLAKRNQRVLDFCLNTYELAFLGTWKLSSTAIAFSDDCAIDADTMRYEFRRYGYDSDDDANAVKFRLKQLKKLAEESIAHEAGKLVSGRKSRCYAITMNTVKNTRNLLDAGVKLAFDKHEDLDAIEKRLESGEKLFALSIGHDGEGYGSYQIYCEENAIGLDKLPVEVLSSESQ